MEECLVFLDGGFISKLSKHLGNGKYLRFDLLAFAKNLSKDKNLLCKKIFYYTAPPFQSESPSEEEIKRKKGYDKFIHNFENNNFFKIREGRVQKIKSSGEEEFKQKGVDSLMVSDMVSVPIKFPEIRKIILVTSDTDFCPIINDINELGIEIILCTYYERKRDSKFSVSHHLIDCCDDIYFLTKKNFDNAPIKK